MEPATMKAIIKPHKGIGLVLAQVPMPSVGARDVLIKVKAASICGSDVPINDWDDPWICNTIMPGQVIGHEFCGVIVGYGEQVDGFALGDYVTAEGHIRCGSCSRCRNGEGHICQNLRLLGFNYPGAFAEFVAVPASNVIPLNNFPLIIGAIQDAFGNAVHGCMKVPLTNCNVLITGCGPLGLMAISIARLSGAKRIFATNHSEYRRKLGLMMGADCAVDPESADITTLVNNHTMDEGGVDVFMEMSGNPRALEQGFSLLRNGGQAILLGLPKEPLQFDFTNQVITKCITIYGITGRLLFKTWEQSHKLLDQTSKNMVKELTKIVTHRFLIEDFHMGIDLMHSRECGKVILFPEVESMLQSYEEIPVI